MFEQTLMPGPLSQAHHKLEADCDNCHRLFNKQAQSELCVACHDHKNIKIDLQKRSGFHGKNKKVGQNACRECHTEHEGRDKGIVVFDPKKFDHRDTDFQLDKSHQKTKCTKCHKKDEPYHKAPSLCIDCHRKKDVHKGSLGKQCGDCHRGPKWKDIEYDHDKARFKLRYAHREVKCKKCHENQKYKYKKMTCDACHLKDDKHKRRLGLKCQDCHTEKKWDDIRFDHNKDTKYRLKGKHLKAKCKSCHTKNPYKNKTTQVCYDCHRKEDEHKQVFGKLCDDCHTERHWKHIRFNHDDTRYVLKGEHRDAKCHGCHLLDKKRDLLRAKCIDCHKPVDIHEEVLGVQCESCHVADGWLFVDQFDHDLSRFPLVGEHMDALCEECHVDDLYRKTTPLVCKDCHFEPEVHRTLFGERCESCHFALDWETWRFSHDRQTDYKLQGKHKQISCYDCHKPEWGGVEPPRECRGCHILDDVHGGTFGPRCGDCHNQKTFQGARIRR